MISDSDSGVKASAELFTLTLQPDYIHIVYPSGFVINAKEITGMWDDLADICKEHNLYNVLVELSKLEHNLDTMEAFNSGVRLSNITPRLSLALCLEVYERDEVSEFFKTVSRNRGAKVEFFSNTRDALKWLGVNEEKTTPKISKFHGNPE